MTSSYLGRHICWVPIEKCETVTSLKRGSALPSIICIQLPLTLTWTSNVHKVQGLSFVEGVIYFDLPKQNLLGPGQMYTVLSSVKTYDKSAIKINKDALLEYERLKPIDLFFTIKRNSVSGNHFQGM